MSLISFLKLVEIQTKVASMIPFTLGTLYALYHFNRFNLQNFLLMFVSLLAFDMATTALNNYYDFKRAQKTHGYNYEIHNAIVHYNLHERTVLTVLVALVSIAVVFGIILVINTSLVVLLLGMISFGVGILYSFGPIPISRTPLGELFSGLFMGFVIIFISVYVHIADMNIVKLALTNYQLAMSVNLLEVGYIFLFSLPAVVGIANIMLANNICDIEDDIQNHRYTLPVYLGKERALTLFNMLYYAAYVDVVFLVLIRIIPISSLLLLLTLIPVKKNLRVFAALQTKKDTFIISVKNFVLINMVHILIIGIATIEGYR